MNFYQNLHLYCNFEMPFYRNLGAIRFESQTDHFQIFRADNDTTIFQSKVENISFFLQTLAEFYQNHLHNSQIQFYCENNKNASIVVPQTKPAVLNKINIDEFCKALLEATNAVIHVSSLFPQQIGDFSISQYRYMNGKLAFFYLPIIEMANPYQRQLELLKGILDLGAKLKDQSNTSHKLLLKKLSKCKKISEISQEITYFYSVYGVGTKSIKLPFQTKEHKIQMNARQNKRKLNMFKMNLPKNRSQNGKLSCFSTSMHTSAPRRNTSLNIGIPDKGNRMTKTVSNSCSTRNSPYVNSKLKFKTINFNSSFHTSIDEKKIETQKSKKSLRKSKVNLTQTVNTQVSINDQQKLLKKLNKQKTESIIKKVESVPSQKQIQKQIASTVKIQKQVAQKNQKQITPIHSKLASVKVLQQSPKVIVNPEPSSPISVKFPTKEQQPLELAMQPRDVPSKTVYKHQSIHVSQSNIQSIPQAAIHQAQPQQAQALPKKLKKKPIRQDDWGSQIEIIDLTAQSKQSAPPNPKMNQTKEINVPKKVQKQRRTKELQDGIQTRKNSWNIKPPVEEPKVNKKMIQLMQKKINLDYMGQTVVNTSGYLKNYEKIFWQLPLFFIYRAFYVLRYKLARQMQALQEFTPQLKDLVDENQQIGLAVNKMAKMITKKLKKQDPNVLKNIKDYLNTDESVNCDMAMKSLLGQYIQSLTDASSDYPELLKHEVQVVDSYLIAKGIHIDHKKQKLQTLSQCHAHLKVQLLKLKQHL